ncbi:hypothetical protein [Egbenema bharatensis]|uniref:hypothetical protein n=1 Tax=Egbenema bharatensis TaxID=3463334 RepID=UPI003A8BEFC9
MIHQLIRTTLIASAVSVLSVPVMAVRALADKADFWVYNNSEATITRLYVSESTRDTWEEDILGEDVLVTGAGIRIAFENESANSCHYDILAVFSDGQVVEDYRVDVCSNRGYTFYD